jgi:hypothetical protein
MYGPPRGQAQSEQIIQHAEAPFLQQQKALTRQKGKKGAAKAAATFEVRRYSAETSYTPD